MNSPIKLKLQLVDLLNDYRRTEKVLQRKLINTKDAYSRIGLKHHIYQIVLIKCLLNKMISSNWNYTFVCKELKKSFVWLHKLFNYEIELLSYEEVEILKLVNRK